MTLNKEYNTDGELCIEGSSDLSGMEKSATIIFTGADNVDDISVEIE